MFFFREIKKYWSFAVYAARSDLQEEVANFYLNWIWWILEPLSSMLIYVLIFGVVFQNDEMYFPIFVFIGITLWDYFSRCLTSSVNLIRNNQHIISRVYIPKYILLIQRMLVLAFKMLICWVIVAAMMIIYKVPIGVNLIYIIPDLAVFFVFCFACSLYFLHFGVYVNDLSRLLSIALNLMFYVTGIFFNIQKGVPAPFGYLLQRINPIAYLIFCLRKSILYGEEPSIIMLGIWLLASLILAAGGIRLVRKNENSYVKLI